MGDKLVMFGTCYAGTKDLATLMLDDAGAIACVAPKPNHAISVKQVIDGYSWLLNKIQAARTIDVGPYELTEFVSDPARSTTFSILTVSPQVSLGVLMPDSHG